MEIGRICRTSTPLVAAYSNLHDLCFSFSLGPAAALSASRSAALGGKLRGWQAKDPDTDADAAPDPVPDLDAEPDPDPDTDPGTGTGTGTDADTETDTCAATDTDTDTDCLPQISTPVNA